MSIHSFGERVFDLSLEAVQPIAELSLAASKDIYSNLKPYERADMLDQALAVKLASISDMSPRAQHATVELIREMQRGELLPDGAKVQLGKIALKEAEDCWITEQLTAINRGEIPKWSRPIEEIWVNSITSTLDA